MPRFRMRNIKALFILNIEKMNIFKIRFKCITFVGIDHIYVCTSLFTVTNKSEMTFNMFNNKISV